LTEIIYVNLCQLCV